MGRNLARVLYGLVGTVLIAGSFRQAGAGSPLPAATELTGPRELGKHIQDITDTILRHHLDPPARQQMILAGIKGLYEAAGLPIPAGLSRRVSALTTPRNSRRCSWSCGLPSRRKASERAASKRLSCKGYLPAFPAELRSPQPRNMRFKSNSRAIAMLVSIFKFVTMKRRSERSLTASCRAAPLIERRMMREDRFEQIDGVDTKDMTLRQVVDRLRGQDGPMSAWWSGSPRGRPEP